MVIFMRPFRPTAQPCATGTLTSTFGYRNKILDAQQVYVPPTKHVKRTALDGTALDGPAEAGHYNPAEAGHYNPAEAGHYNPAEAGHYNPGEAGHYNPAEAGHYNPAEAGHYNPAEAGHYNPAEAGHYNPGEAGHYNPAEAAHYEYEWSPRSGYFAASAAARSSARCALRMLRMARLPS
jgi:hypothetical protein